MNREEVLEKAIRALGDVMIVSREYFDMDTARIAMEAHRALIGRRSDVQIRRMEAAQKVGECDPNR
jgi:hypothetical protein